MGIEYSSESQEGLPVTGLPTSLEVLKVARGKWVKKENIILRLKENGSKYSISDLSGADLFRLEEAAKEDEAMVLVDVKGREIGGFICEKLCSGKRAFITVKKDGIFTKKSEGKVWAAATLDQPPDRPGNSCQIYLHNPPILTEEFDPEKAEPSLTVEGDVVLKEYDVLAKDGAGLTVKIARGIHDLSEMEGVKMNLAVDKGNVYYLQVGRNIDIAFLVLCAHAMDQMFYDKDYD